MESSKQVRDYDKDPIKIINYSVLFESHLILLIALFAVPILINDIYQLGSLTLRLSITLVVWIGLLYLVFIKIPQQFKLKSSYFLFENNTLQYHFSYLIKEAQDIDLVANINTISTISYCTICELPESYGRWHYLTGWQLYRRSSIGVHIGKATLFIRYIITYCVFILPYKLFRLKSTGESSVLLKRNLFIQFTNRNYFLVNIYSQKELDELIEYFKLHNKQITNKTYLIPHLQNQGWFVDKNEIWTNEFKNQGEEQ